MEATKYTLERSLLRKADIILTRDKTLVSTGIRVAILGKYSHAAIYIGGTTIEATLKGVFSKNPQRLIFNQASDVAVYRSKNELSERELETICSHAQSKVGSLYALDEAVTIRARSTLRLEEKRRQFCSRLVANAYAYIGYDFINIRNPAYCTPKQIGLCKAFERIDGVVRPATIGEIEFSRSPDPALENLNQTYEWLNKARSLVISKFSKKWDIQTINDVDEFLKIHPELDEEISSYVKKSGYLDFFHRDEEINPHRYEERLFLNILVSVIDRELFIESELEKENDIVPRFTKMLEHYIALSKQLNLQYYFLHVNLYTNLIKQIHRRVEVIRNVLKMTGNKVLAEDMSVLVEAAEKIAATGNKHLLTIEAMAGR